MKLFIITLVLLVNLSSAEADECFQISDHTVCSVEVIKTEDTVKLNGVYAKSQTENFDIMCNSGSRALICNAVRAGYKVQIYEKFKNMTNERLNLATDMTFWYPGAAARSSLLSITCVKP